MNLAHRPDDARDRNCILKGLKKGVHVMLDFVVTLAHLGLLKLCGIDIPFSLANLLSRVSFI